MANKTYSKSSLKWDKLIEGYRTSGKSAEKWCEEQGFKVHQLRFQISKRSKMKKDINTKKVSFLPIEVIPESNDYSDYSTSISLKIGKIEICISDNFNPNLLAEVIKTLQPLC